MPWILITEEAERERRFVLDEGVSIVGTHIDVDVVVDHPTVSRRHAQLTLGEELSIEDLGSSNGTRLDGASVTGPQEIALGQRIHFGQLAARLEHSDAAETEAALHFDAPDPQSAPSPAAAGTLSVGSIRDFVLVALPGIVQRLEERRGSDGDGGRRTDDGLAVVQAAGQALFDSFPCRYVEILGRGAGGADQDQAVLFRAAVDDAPSPPETAELEQDPDVAVVDAGPLSTRVGFIPGLHQAGVVPLVELVTRLAALEQPRSEDAGPLSSRSNGSSSVPLPEPATVDTVVRRIYEDARRIARGDVGVLVMGESGTGKEVFAKFVHACSARAGGELVALNCAALPQDLLEAELFGIEKGVATGVEARAGKFEQADGGTLFLDEIGDMAPATQAKILRVLQEGEVYRLGGRAPRPARVRVIAATNRDLASMIDDGDFRLDLYHRIADCRFTLPPLRERLADLPNLAAHFLQRSAAEQGVRVRGVSRAALEALLAFTWPGNVRQLEREMARAALFLEDGELLQTRHLHSEIAGGAGERSEGGRSLRARLESTERGLIIQALSRHDGSVREAAEELEIGRTTLYRRLQELGIET